jgi:hypothetical protein
MQNLDRRWIFLSMGLLVLVFLKLPVELPMTPGAETQGYYDAIDSLPPGSIIYLSADYGPSTMPELYPMHVGTVYQAFKKDCKVIAASVWETGPPMVDMAFRDALEKLAGEGITRKYGVDYVNLGFKAGQDVAIAKIGSSIPETYPLDSRGTPVEQLPIMQGVEDFDQIGVLCNFSAGTPGARQWLQQVQKRYKVRMVAGVTAVMAPDLYAFFQSGQLEGFLGALVGAAEYEGLLETPGPAMAGMTVQSLAHVLIIFFIVVGNGLFLLERQRLKRKEAGSQS